MTRLEKRLLQGFLGIAGIAAFGAGAYASFAGVTWLRYGTVTPEAGPYADTLLDRFMPRFEVVERHRIRVKAPATITFDAAKDSDINDSLLVRAIFKARAIALGADPEARPRRVGIVEETRALGWGVLAEVPGREIVMGAVTQPWKADVIFRALPPEEFAGFRDPGYVKIVWTLRAEDVGPSGSVFITETRVATTDAFARQNFRRYWSWASPGIVLIRKMSLRLVKRDAERRYRTAGSSTMNIVPPIAGRSM